MKRLAILLLLTTPALAAPPPGTDLNSPLHHWFHDQHSIKGLWCCDVSDGHILSDEDWRMKLIPAGESDSGYEVRINNEWVPVPQSAMRDPNGGPNPTGHAIAWYLVNEYGATIYCFAPGWQG